MKNGTSRRLLVASGVVACVTVILAALSFNITPIRESTATAATDDKSVTILDRPTTAPNQVASPQCRANALNAYALQEDFKPGQYTVDDLNTSAPEVHKAGDLHFWKTVDSRDTLGELFASKDPGAVAQQKQQETNFPDVDQSTLFNTNNWGVLQSLVPSNIGGNLGFSGGTTRALGTRVSTSGGDAVWLFVDPATCTVPFTAQDAAKIAVAKANGATIQLASFSVGLIRVACSNVGSYLSPKDWSLNVTKPSGSVTVQPSGPLLPPEPAPTNPAPTQQKGVPPVSPGTAPGADPAPSGAPAPSAPVGGTTVGSGGSGSAGSGATGSGSNNTDPGLPTLPG